mgnify:CR=1 FL=1
MTRYCTFVSLRSTGSCRGEHEWLCLATVRAPSRVRAHSHSIRSRGGGAWLWSPQLMLVGVAGASLVPLFRTPQLSSRLTWSNADLGKDPGSGRKGKIGEESWPGVGLPRHAGWISPTVSGGQGAGWVRPHRRLWQVKRMGVLDGATPPRSLMCM